METTLIEPVVTDAHHKVTPRGWFSRLLWRFIRYDIDKYTLVISKIGVGFGNYEPLPAYKILAQRNRHDDPTPP